MDKREQAQTASRSAQQTCTPPEIANERLVAVGTQAAKPSADSESEVGKSVAEDIWTDKQTEFAYFLHQYLRDFIKFADQKAAFIFALSSGIAAFLVRSGAHKIFLTPLSSRSFSDWAAFLACISAAVAGLLSLAVVLPRLRGRSTGVIYWKGIVGTGSALAYQGLLRAADNHRITGALLEHCYELAQIADRKYEILKWALWVGAVGVVASGVLLGL
jgi:hypothetical protein